MDANESVNRGICKRIDRMERWLKRCAVSCGCGAWSSALMDMECLQAEAREFRDELWTAAENGARETESARRGNRLFATARVTLLALLFVVTTGFPLSIDQEVPFKGFRGKSESIALLTATESDIISGLRSTLSSGNVGRVILTVDLPEQRTKPEKMRGAASASGKEPSAVTVRTDKPQVAKTPTQALPAPTPKKEPASTVREVGELSVEEVVTLIQVGQRALMGTEPVIKIAE